MTPARRAVAICVAAGIGLSCLYVPFQIVAKGAHLSAGYGWIFAPRDDFAIINVAQLLAEWAGLLIIGALLWIAAAPASPEGQWRGSRLASDGEDIERSARNKRIEPVTIQRRRLPLVRWIGMLAAVLAIASFLWFFSRSPIERNAPAPAPSPADICTFAMNMVLLEQWTDADTSLDATKGAERLFGPNAQRSWTVQQGEELGDKVNALRRYVSNTPRASSAVKSWLVAVTTRSDTQGEELEYVRRLLFNHCTYG